MGSAARILEAILREVEAGRRAALCVITASRGSTPQPAGTMICVDQNAEVTGTLGGGCVEADVRRRAHQLLIAGRSRLITFALDNDFGYDDGMICGGRMDVAVSLVSSADDIESLKGAVKRLLAGRAATVPVCVDTSEGLVEYRLNLEAEPRLIIAGAGHISRVLAEMMVSLGFSVDVIDDRADFANAERFPHPIRTTVGDIAGTLRSRPINNHTYIVIVTRGHKHDEAALKAVLDSPAKYLGMIGSRRKVKVVFDDLRHAGAAEESLSRVHAPIGLKIGAVTAEEIALSIAAELVSVRRADHRNPVEGPIARSEL